MHATGALFHLFTRFTHSTSQQDPQIEPVNLSTSLKQTPAAIQAQLFISPLTVLLFLTVSVSATPTNRQAILRSNAPSSSCPSPTLIQFTIYLTLRSNCSFISLESSRWRFDWAPRHPRMLPAKTSSSVIGWAGRGEKLSMVSESRSS